MPSVTTAADLGLLIRESRRERGLSQQRLAEAVGVSRQWIVSVEGGKDRAEIALVLRVLNVLDLRIQVDPRPEAAVDLSAHLARLGREP